MLARSFIIVLCSTLLCVTSEAKEMSVVGFDTPAIIVAEPVNPAVVQSPTMGGELMRLRVPISTFISPEFRGRVTEYIVEIDSPGQSCRVIDFWPKNEMYSDIDGTVSVESSQQKDVDFAFNISGGFEPFGRGNASGNYHDKTNQSERYQRKPPMQVLTSSGTIRRGFGVFFKFRPGPTPVLEGGREVAVLVEVPHGWRADMFQVNMRAVGHRSPSSSSTASLGSARLWMVTHREGDAAAAAHARQYVSQERSLRAYAAASREQVEDRSLPTMWHKLGAALDVVDPRIPSNYLSQVIFGPSDPQFSAGTHRLPVDLRVEVLDYWESREALVELARPVATGHVVAKPRVD